MGVELMRIHYVLALAMIASVAQAKDQKHYQTGKLLRMDSVPCGMDQKNAKSLAGEMLGTDSAHMKTQEVLCQEYLLESNKVTYRIRPREDKHPALLPIGEKAQFRIEKDKMLLRVEDADDKERQYVVVSMTPTESSDSDAHDLAKKN